VKRTSFKASKRVVLSVVVVASILIVLSSLFFFNALSIFAAKPQKITVGTLPVEAAALLYIAQNQSFFSNNGLDVVLKPYDTGPMALNALSRSEVDIAGAAEYPVVARVFQKENISIIACIAKTQYIELVARKDRGIEQVSDLSGKTIGFSSHTISEFYLYRFLNVQGLMAKNITFVDVQPAQFLEAVTNGSVDAIVAWEPYISQIKKQLGTEPSTWSIQSGQSLYYTLTANNKWIQEHTVAIKAFLKSLVQAEQYVINYPNKTEEIIGNYVASESKLEGVLNRNQFYLSLDHGLILAMEDEARWMTNNNLTSATETPDFLNYVYVDGLNTIKPESVNIIR